MEPAGRPGDRGNLLVVPIERSLVYVEPLYIAAEQGRLPELKRVIVGFRDRIAMEETLDGALARVFGGGRPRAAVERHRVLRWGQAEAKTLLDAADALPARQRGTARRLGELLQQLRRDGHTLGLAGRRKERMVDVMEVPYDRFRDGRKLSPGVTTRGCR